MKKILIVEDDNDINSMLTQLLNLNGYASVSAYSGTEALLIDISDVDLIILDLMLVGKNGNEIIGELKAKRNIPIIVVSAVCDIDMKVNLFELGADDYVTKPFNNKELLARIEARLKTSSISSSNVYNYKDLMLDINTFEVNCNGKKVSLSKIEFEILRLLMSNPTQVFTKSIIIEKVWDTYYSADENVLNVHISNIRNKLEQANKEKEYIKTIWSVGYRMN